MNLGLQCLKNDSRDAIVLYVLTRLVNHYYVIIIREHVVNTYTLYCTTNTMSHYTCGGSYVAYLQVVYTSDRQNETVQLNADLSL